MSETAAIGDVIELDAIPTDVSVEELLTQLPSIVMIPGDSPMAAIGADPNTRSRDYYNAARSTDSLDKESYRRLVKMCKNVLCDEGLVTRHVDLIIGLSALGTVNKYKRGVLDRYKQVFDGFVSRVNEGYLCKVKGLNEFQKQFAYYYNTAGLIVTIERVAPMGFQSGNQYFTSKVPVEMDFIDPLRANLDYLYTDNAVYYDLSDNEVAAIRAMGVKHPLLKMYEDKAAKSKTGQTIYTKSMIVEMVKEGKDSIPLPTEKVRIYRRTLDATSPYPIPVLASTLTALADKSMLRESDRSVLSKLINMILMYKVGKYGADGKKIDAGDKTLSIAMGTFLQNVQRSKNGRVVIQFSPDSHDISYVMPDTKNLMNEGMYHTANSEVMATLVGPAAWQLLTNSPAKNNDLYMKVIWTQHETFLAIYKGFIEGIYSDIVAWNKMRFDPTNVILKSRRITILDTAEFTAMRGTLADKGQISTNTMVEDAGECLEAEIEDMIAEQSLREQYGILQATPTFTQSTVDPSGGTKTISHPRSKGRPPGVVEKTQRQTSPQD